MKQVVFRVCLAFILGYIGFAAHGELKLIRLLQKPLAGTEYNTINSANLSFYDSHEYGIYEEDLRRQQLHSWTEILDEWQVFLLYSLVAGFFGGTVHDIREKLRSPTAQWGYTYLLGAAMGVSLYVVSALFPLVMIEGEPQLRPPSVAALSFLGGLFADLAWSQLRGQAERVFGG